MGDWAAVCKAIRESADRYDLVRTQALEELHQYTNRNSVIYYSGWLQKSHLGLPFLLFEINDVDMNSFMSVVSRLPKDRGLDLILHTPGGDAAATEAIGDYLRSLFSDIRVIVPQLALSAGTMLACIGSRIVMGKHSCLGGFDPLMGNSSARTIVDDFWNAVNEVKKDSANAIAWSTLIHNYAPFVSEAQRAIEWSEDIVTGWLSSDMLSNEQDPENAAKAVIAHFTQLQHTKAHRRHIGPERAAAWGLKVDKLEQDPRLQDLVLTVHHSTVATLTDLDAYKIIQGQASPPVVLRVAKGDSSEQ
ncbi:MAG TPA: ATP-dependent Clp protease proteolytic subunit [Candidatus Baltobacteraceae bacterium]|nr:ATP-dependent Clp protease proteolytic subunit [Candidatus Baltobacteraceae bacterium]